MKYKLLIQSEHHSDGWKPMPFEFNDLGKAINQAEATMKRKGLLVKIKGSYD